jgi:hypothetical protein
MRRSIPFILLLLAAPLLLAMGGSGGMPASDTIPRPKERFTAELVDRQGVVTRVTFVSANGKTFFPLKRGEGTLMVPFSRLVHVRFGTEREAEVEATFQVEGGRQLEGRLPRGLPVTGVTDFGNYQVEVRGLREISFLRS